MATRRFDLAFDARVGTDGSLNLGAGACDHLPYGSGGGYTYQSLMKFTHDWSDMTDVQEVRLHVRNSDEYHLVRGGSGARSFRFQPVTNSWSAGTASHPMTSSNSVVWGDTTVDTTRQTGPHSPSDTNSDWSDFDVTNAARYTAPASLTFPQGPGLGNTNRGFRIVMDDSGDSGEFWSEDKGSNYAAYLIVTFTNHAANETVVGSPGDGTTISGGGTFASPSVPVTAAVTCPSAHAITNVEFQLDNTSDFSSLLLTSSDATGISGGSVSRTLGPSASIPRGTPLYIRSRCTCSAGIVSPWSNTVTFDLNNAALPVITGATDQVMECDVAGDDAAPRATVRWTYTDPAGEAQWKYQAIMYADDGTTVLQDSGVVTSSANFFRFSLATAPVRGTFYKFKVQVWNVSNLSAGATSLARRKAQWGIYTQYKSIGSTPTNWRYTIGVNEPTNTRINVQHSSSATSTPGAWKGALGDVPLNSFYHVKYWLFAWHGAATPSVTSFTFYYSLGIAMIPDRWTLDSQASISTDKFVLGSRSLRMKCTAPGWHTTYSGPVSVRPNSPYILSSRQFAVGTPQAHVRVVNAARSAVLAYGTVTNAPSSVWEYCNSPSFTTGASEDTVIVECLVNGPATSEAFFDCIQIEPGTVVGPYRPGSIGLANVVDSGGIQVDASAGGVFRLRGALGANDPNANSELGAMGMEVGVQTFREIIAPGTPATGKVYVYAKSDGALYKKDDTGVESAIGGGGGAHPDLATHNTLGLATQAELDAVAATIPPNIMAMHRHVSSTQSLASNIGSFSFATFEAGATVYDPNGFISANSFIIPVGMGGWYRVSFDPEFASNATGARRVGIRRNAANATQTYAGSVTNQSFSLPLFLIDYLAAGDVMEFMIAQNTGANLVMSKKTFAIEKLT